MKDWDYHVQRRIFLNYTAGCVHCTKMRPDEGDVMPMYMYHGSAWLKVFFAEGNHIGYKNWSYGINLLYHTKQHVPYTNNDMLEETKQVNRRRTIPF